MQIEDWPEPVMPLIFTIGYEGMSLDEFSRKLSSNGVKRLIDVREIPWSRKPGFSMRRLSEELSDRGIGYLHLRSLGSPKSIRDELKQDDDFDKFAEAYREHLKMQRESLDILLSEATDKPTAIMCFERDPARCHRSIIASELGERGFSVRNL